MPASTIYKLLTRTEWEAAQAAGVYCGSAHDRRDGFIHFSAAGQLAETARKYFSGVPDLVLLAVDAAALTESLTPHPALLPMGEGTLEHGTMPAATSPLPEGEGQGEGYHSLRWEPSRGGDLFPHLYANLPIAAVTSVIAIPLAADGVPIIPSELAP